MLDSKDNAYVSMSLHGEVIKIDPNGSKFTLVRLPLGTCGMPYAQIPFPGDGYGLVFPLGGQTFGLAMDEDDNIYIALLACSEGMPNPPVPNPNSGVWKVNTVTREFTLVTQQAYPDRGDPNVCCRNSFEPGVYTYAEIWNGLEVLGDYIYMTNSFYGEIWRAPTRGGAPELFFTDDRIKRDQDLSVPFFDAGLNGIKYFEGSFIFANTYKGEIWKLNLVSKDGDVQPGALVLYLQYDSAVDELDIDEHGRVWFADFNTSKIGIGYPDGSYEVVLTQNNITAEGGYLDRPTSVRFGRNKNQNTLMIANSGFPLIPPYYPGYPALLSVEVNAKGYQPKSNKGKRKKNETTLVEQRGYGLVEHLAIFDDPVQDPFNQYGISRFPTSIVVDSHDNAYLAMNGAGEVWKMTPDGVLSTVVKGLPLNSVEECSAISSELNFPIPLPNLSPLGLALDEQNNMYACVNVCDEEDPRSGVYRIDVVTGTFEMVAAMPRFPGKGIASTGFPDIWNGVEYHNGKLYMSNSFYGEVWCAPVDGSGEASLWSDDPLIKDLNRVIEGANGIVYHKGDMYVSNSGTGLITKLEIPHGDDCGVSVSASIYANIGVGCDEFAFAQDGTIFCGSVQRGQNGVHRWRVGDESGTQILDRTDFFFDVTNSVAFGRIGDNKHELYIVNSGIPFTSEDFVSAPTFVRVRVAEMGA